MRRGRKKLNSHALPFVARIAQEHHAALLLLHRFGIRQDQHFALVDFMLEHEQGAVGVYDHGFARFAEFTAVVPTSVGLNPHFVKDASAAARRDKGHFAHTAIFE